MLDQWKGERILVLFTYNLQIFEPCKKIKE